MIFPAPMIDDDRPRILTIVGQRNGFKGGGLCAYTSDEFFKLFEDAEEWFCFRTLTHTDMKSGKPINYVGEDIALKKEDVIMLAVHPREEAKPKIIGG